MRDDSPDLLSRVIGWLTAGYPEGVPATDRIAVIALLKRRLTDEQVMRVVTDVTVHWIEIGSDDPITRDKVEQMIHQELQVQPSDADIERVSARLAAGGWPMEGSLEAAARRHVGP
jgi:hypothetical protein